jgi:hypothetical protein
MDHERNALIWMVVNAKYWLAWAGLVVSGLLVLYCTYLVLGSLFLVIHALIQ